MTELAFIFGSACVMMSIIIWRMKVRDSNSEKRGYAIGYADADEKCRKNIIAMQKELIKLRKQGTAIESKKPDTDFNISGGGLQRENGRPPG